MTSLAYLSQSRADFGRIILMDDRPVLFDHDMVPISEPLSPNNNLLYQNWQQLRQQATPGRLPLRKDFRPEKMRAVLAYMWVSEVVGDDFRIRLAGAEVDQMAGQSLSGKLISEIPQQFSVKLMQVYRRVIAEQCPITFRNQASAAAVAGLELEVVSLPYLQDAPTPTIIISAFDISAAMLPGA